MEELKRIVKEYGCTLVKAGGPRLYRVSSFPSPMDITLRDYINARYKVVERDNFSLTFII